MNTSHSVITLNSPAFWIANALTLFFIALLTYTYSGKNLKLAAVVSFLAAIAVGCGAGYDSWNYYLAKHFLAGIDQLGVPYRASRSGWYLLIDTWPLWLVPSVLISLSLGMSLWYIQKWLHQRTSIKQYSITDRPKRLGRTSERVTTQLELDALKRSLAAVNQKLSQALHEKDIEEARSKELQLKLTQYEAHETNRQLTAEDESQALRIELSVKNDQLHQLNQQVAEQEDEINRLKALVESLLNK